jgi:hypothetical protein
MRSKRLLFAAVLVGIFLLGARWAYRSRLRIEAKAWHWRHGHAVIVAAYEVPVPDGWLVENSDPREGFALLIDTRVKGTSDPLANVNYILIVSEHHSQVNLDFWKSQSEQSLKQKGIGDIREEMLQTKDESVSCVGGQFNLVTGVRSAATSMQCMSAGGLFMTFTGNEEGLPEIFNIISQMRRRV